MPLLTTPLTDAELERLEDILYDLNSGTAMSPEEMDGFFCALICSPEVVPPSEYLPHVWGRNDPQQSGFKTVEEDKEALTLITRHWNAIAATLQRDEPYSVLIAEDDEVYLTGQEWAARLYAGDGVAGEALGEVGFRYKIERGTNSNHGAGRRQGTSDFRRPGDSGTARSHARCAG